MLKTNFQHILLLSAAILLFVGISFGLISPPRMHHVGVALRCVAIALLALFALRRRSLTPWIFVAMVAGAELGFDAPSLAVNLRVFSDIFLRLIKTIVAPLILATLVTGIAGHGDLKSVGRMGIKSLVYFEVVTTLALVGGRGCRCLRRRRRVRRWRRLRRRTGRTFCCTCFRRILRSRWRRGRFCRWRCLRSSSGSHWRR